jgi:peptidyl-prolyl cis-trans isomerase D
MAKNKPKPSVLSKKHIARLERERRQTLLIRYVTIAIVVFIVSILAYGYLDMTVLQLRQPVAKVGNDAITTREFQMRVRLQRSTLINTYSQTLQLASMFGMDPSTDPNISSQLQQIQSQLDSTQTIGQNVLQDLIDDRLIRQEAKRRGITVTQDEIDQAIQSAHGYFPLGSPTPTVTPTEVTLPTLSPETLALVTLTPTPTTVPTSTPTPTATPNPAATPTTIPSPTPTSSPEPTATPYTLEAYQQDYQSALEQYKTIGMTEADYRYLVESSLYYQKVFDVITADTPHIEDMVWARHILVNDEATAVSVRQRLLNGGDFAIIAAEVSQDTGTKDNGGDLGWFSKGQMVDTFEQAAFSLKVGEISEPVKSTYGYHIIQVLGHEMRPLTASQYNQAQQTEFQNWLQQGRQSSDVKTYDIWQDRVPVEPTLPPDLIIPSQ